MKRIQDRKNIKLLNDSTSQVFVSSGKKEYAFEGAVDGEPIAYFFDWDEIEGINSRSNAIKNGTLVFSIGDRAEGYPALKMPNWEETIMFNETIEDIINNPTIENLEKVIAIRDVHTIERFRGKMLARLNNGHGVDSRFMDVVNGRFNEINSGIAKSKLILKPTVDYSGAEVGAKVDELKAKNEAMEKELAEMKAAMAELMKASKKETKKIASDIE